MICTSKSKRHCVHAAGLKAFGIGVPYNKIRDDAVTRGLASTLRLRGYHVCDRDHDRIVCRLRCRALPISVHVPGFNTAEIAIDVLRLCESVPFARRGSIDIGPSIDTLDDTLDLDIADLA